MIITSINDYNNDQLTIISMKKHGCQEGDKCPPQTTYDYYNHYTHIRVEKKE